MGSPVKQTINLPFTQGLDQKTDPFQVAPGKFLTLENSVFDKGGLLKKRNGYGKLAPLPDSATFLTTFNGDLTAIGTSLQAYSTGSRSWVTKGTIQPTSVFTMPLLRNNLNQSQSDCVQAPNGLICTVYTEVNAGTNSYKYVIADSETGQNIIAPTVISTANATYGTPRVFLLGTNFVILFTSIVTATYHLNYMAISTVVPTMVVAPVSITANYTPAATVAFDGYVMNNTLYIAWNGASASGIQMVSLSATLGLSSTVVRDASHSATMVSVCADAANRIVWVSYWDAGTTNGYTLAVDSRLNVATAPTLFAATKALRNLTSSAQNIVNTMVYEIANAYSYDGAIATNYIESAQINQFAVPGSTVILARSVGLGSKSVIVDGVIYFLASYSSSYQPGYYVLNSSGNVIARLAYQNGGGYLTTGLPTMSLVDTSLMFSYRFKDLIAAVNKGTALSSGTQTAGIYSQTGINLGFVDLDAKAASAEIGSNLQISGGFLWMYDGYLPVEQNFFLYPENVEATWSATGGSISAKPDGTTNTNAYWYQITYEWTDNQGNSFRSAPSIPIPVTTTGSAATGSITVNVPTLRLTYKTANPVKIVIYRWDVAQQIYYQVTSLTSPLLNNPAVDQVQYVDTSTEAVIRGNNILYTTGGVIENIGPPATDIVTLYQSRLFLVDAEDQNLLWFSKQVIEATPVEMSDLLTIYVAPTASAQGPTGPITALSSLDDKLIIYKKNAIYYINGQGPDNTGANNQFSDPIFITATVGCVNPNSIVFQPGGLMFQSDKGIWLLGRDLSTNYIGAPVETFTQGATVQSAVSVPGTNQVRFTLDTGVTLMYDYYFGQWGTFVGVPCLSSTLYQNLHTFINQYDEVFQENVGSYLDGSNPVLMNFTSAWINLAGLQGLQRAYGFYFLATYISPHKLSVGISYDYNSAIQQQAMITPDNYNPAFGNQPGYFGDGGFGGEVAREQWCVNFEQQQCQSFQISIKESYDPSLGAAAGAGFTMSGLNLMVGAKRGYARLSPNKSIS